MALGGWQTVDEISGTCGWSNQATANAWTGKIAAYFQTNDPFRHPTEASQGNYWAAGDSVNDLSNTEVYGNLSDTNIASTVQTLWTGFKKPCIMGETGYVQDVTVFHSVLWSALAAGASITPLWWAFLPDQNWNNADSAQYPPFVKFIAGLNVAGLTSLAQAHVAVAGAKAWGITSDQVAFGWISGTISGKNLQPYRAGKWQLSGGMVGLHRRDHDFNQHEFDDQRHPDYSDPCNEPDRHGVQNPVVCRDCYAKFEDRQDGTAVFGTSS